jgi:hypothetical protein
MNITAPKECSREAVETSQCLAVSREIAIASFVQEILFHEEYQ